MPTLWARTTGAADGVGVVVGVGEADGEADVVAAGPLVEPPHAASVIAEKASIAIVRAVRVTAYSYGKGLRPSPVLPPEAEGKLSDREDFDLALFDLDLQ